MSKAERIHKSNVARTRRKNIKEILYTQTINFYTKMRKLRKKNKK